MTGLVGYAGSKSGTIGYVRNEWKLCNAKNLDGHGDATFTWTVSNGIKMNTFLRYKIILSGIQNHTGSEAELRFRWSCTIGVSGGYSSGGYHGGRWTMGHGGSFTSASDSDEGDMRVCFMNASSSDHGHSHSDIIIENLGVSAAGSGSTYNGAIAQSVGRVHSTSASYYGVVYAGEVNNNGPALASANGGELTALTIGLSAGNFDKGYARLYGFIK